MTASRRCAIHPTMSECDRPPVPQAALAQLEAGVVDMVKTDSVEDIIRLRPDPGYQVVQHPLSGTYYTFTMWIDNKPFTDNHVRQALKLVIDRLTAYAEAGADCLYAPGIKTAEEIAAVVKAVHPKPVNLLIGASGLSVKQAEDLGVRRISVGGSLARVAWAGFMRSAREMAEKGTFTELANGYSGGELNKMFG